MSPAIICNPLLFISSSFKLPYLRYNIARTQLEERQDSKANTNEKYHNRCTSVQRLQEPNKNVWLLTADNRIYHKACFRCHHCRGTLKLSNYSSFEGVLYCRPHYDQLFKRTGSLDKSFEGTPKIVKPEKPVDNENASKVSNLFAGTREKCVGCNKTVYPIEKVSVNGTPYHRSCFKCTHGGCTISPSNYIAHEGKLYCKHHHIQLFKEKGNYSQLENEREKNPVTVNITAVEIAAES
ncbi:LIM domain-containing protein [Salix suchowensis]|nr:LIM domain-containing protein [Salix suchowensis]